jgi:plastocyanin
MKRSLLMVTAAAVLLTLLGCSSGSSKVEAGITNAGFDPATISVRRGTTITWTNRDNKTHTVTTTATDSGAINKGETYTATLEDKGTIEYKCRLHKGEVCTVTVK